MTTLWLDRETYCDLDLKEVGTYRYADEAEDLLVAYAIDDEPAKVWDVTDGPCPADLYDALQNADEVVAHNAQFDKAIHNGPKQAHLPRVALSRWRCSMAQALSHALPGSLSDLCAVLRVPEDMSKLSEGKKLIQLFTRPQPANRKIARATRLTHPTEWARFIAYAANDIEAMRECVRRMPRWNWDASAIEEWHCDQRINERGFQVDQELTAAGARAAVTEKARIAVRFREITGGLNPGQRDKVKEFVLNTYGLRLDDTKADTFLQLLKQDGLHPEFRELMTLSMASNKTSTAKYAALDPAVQADGRFRGGLQFAGASRTRRWAGRMFQPQNLPSRGLPDSDSVEFYIETLKAGSHDLFFTDLMRYGAAALRGVVIAPPTKKLDVADLSNIEGRILAWVSGEEWKLKAFREYDAGTGPDLYNVTAVSIIGGDPWKVAKSDRNVFGKVPDLACLGADTQVLTHRGLVRIVDVRKDDLLWDGLEWVNHDGLSDNGVRPVVNVDGIEATPDHLINTQGTWLQAQEHVSSENLLSRALETGSESFRSLTSYLVHPAVSALWKSGAPAVRPPTRSLSGTCATGAPHGATHAPNGPRPTLPNDTGGTQTCVLTSCIVGACSTASLRASTGAAIRTTNRTQTTVVEAFAYMRSGSETGSNSSPTCSPCPGGTSPNWNSTELMSTEATSPATSDLSPESRTGTTNGPSLSCKPECRNSKRVYDLVNAGPRHRFLVRSNSGWLLVHNSGYMGGVAGYQTFAKAYNTRMADHWETIQRQISPALVTKAWENFGKWGYEGAASLEISEVEWVASETCKLAWRARHPATVKFWYALQDAARNAINEWGRIFEVGPYIKVRCADHRGQKWLVVRLPSGRHITYFDPKLENGKDITYMGEASESGKTTRQWVRVHTHGGKMTGNCLSESAKVLTSEGAKAINQVRKGDLVWDGLSWVSTDGAVAQGKKAVGTWLNLEITPDHLILAGNSWKPVTQLDECFTHDALLSAASSITSPSFAARREIQALQSVSASAEPLEASTCANSGEAKGYAAASAPTQPCPTNGATRLVASKMSLSAPYGVGGTSTSYAGATTPSAKPFPTMEAEGSKCSCRGELIEKRSSPTCERCLGGTNRAWTSTDATTLGGTNPGTSASFLDSRTAITDDQTDWSLTETASTASLSSGDGIAPNGDLLALLRTTSTKGAPPPGLWQSTTKVVDVFDLLNCGPNNRFTVLTDYGPVIVHNCCQTLARDVLMPALQTAEKRGYLPVLSVHDEAICEAPDTDEFDAQGLIDILATNPAWATGLPLAAAGFETARYKKD